MMRNKEHHWVGMTLSNYPQGQNSKSKMDSLFKFNSYKKHDNPFVDLIFIFSLGYIKQPTGKVLCTSYRNQEHRCDH